MDKFDQKIKDALENQEVPTEKVWQAIESGMHQAPKKGLNWKTKKVAILVAILVLASGSALTIQAMYSPKDPQYGVAKEDVRMENQARDDSNDTMASQDVGTTEILQDPTKKIVTTVTLEIESKGFKKSLSSIESLVKNEKGYIETSSFSDNSTNQVDNGVTWQRESNNQTNEAVDLVLRIPKENSERAIRKLEKTGHVVAKNITNQDMSLTYQDVTSRKKVLVTEQEKLMELLTKATTVEDTIVLEKRLSEIRYELENIESQLRGFDNQLEYTTIYLSLKNVSIFTESTAGSIWERIADGFVANVQGLQIFLVNVFVWLLTNSLSLLGIGVIGWLLYKAIQKWRKNNKI